VTVHDQIAIARTVARRFRRAARDLDVDDLQQDAMLQIVKSAPWDGRGEEGAYYAVLARWACMNRLVLRERRHHRSRRSVSLDQVPDHCVRVTPLQDRHVDSRARVVRVRLAIAGLPRRQRTVVRRHCLAGVAIGDVARELGVSPRAAAQLLFVARRRLRMQILQEDRP
jgi:RNA polymerase sigma factor (sigma-70 family)